MTFDSCIDNVCLKCEDKFDQIRGCPVGHIPYAVQLIDLWS